MSQPEATYVKTRVHQLMIALDDPLIQLKSEVATSS
jgi:hypothetical protein